uniref:Uncharacterized protein n=1 Tax=Anguilla anguilla TaxID=7936 RepID=A0A0E9RMP7_ANGAN
MSINSTSVSALVFFLFVFFLAISLNFLQ